MESNTHHDVYQAALRILAKQDYSRSKMRTKLAQKGFEAAAIEAVIQELLEKKYLREDLYTEAKVKGLLSKNYSNTFIKNKLQRELPDLDAVAIAEIAAEKGSDPGQRIEHLLHKKSRLLQKDEVLTPEEIRKNRDKVLRFLLSKGHSYAECKKALSSYGADADLDLPLD